MSSGKVVFSKEMNKNMNKLFLHIDRILEEMNRGFRKEEVSKLSWNYMMLRRELQNIEKSMQEEHFKNLRKGKYKCAVGIVYSDIYNEVINLGNYALNVTELLIQ